MSNAFSGLPPVDEVSVYRSLFAAYPDALLLVDKRGVIVLANAVAARLLGYERTALVGMPVEALVPDAIRSRHSAYRDAYALDPRPRPMGTHMDLVARRRDGSEVMVEIALSPLQDHGLPYVVAAIRGIAEYPRVKRALQRARYNEFVVKLSRLAVDTRDPQELMRCLPMEASAALEMESVAVFLLEPSGLAFRVSSAFGEPAVGETGHLVANRPDTAIGFVVSQAAPMIVTDFAAETRFKVAPRLLALGARSGLAVPLSDKGKIIGAIATWTMAERSFGEDEVSFLEALANLLVASLQRAQTEAQLGHSQRLESVGQLTGGIAHDFNNLLTVIQGNLQVLDDHPALQADASARQMLAAATRASRRAADLTGKLLAFSRRQVLSPSPVDVGALLESLADMLRRTLDQRIRIEVAADPSCPDCLADAVQLESALLNIAINSRDAMPDGGSITFACRPATELPADVAAELGAEPDTRDGFVVIDIADTGGGMPPDVQALVFEPFFTTKAAGRGTGLGLSTVYGFVKQSKGSIRLRTALGSGTTVSMVLPRAPGAGAAAAEVAPGTGALREGLKVVLVEDEPEVRNVVRNLLKGLGCEVTEFSNAEQALANLGEVADHDLLLSDIVLGAGQPGTEFAREVRARLPKMAVLLMSGYAPDLLGAAAGPAEPGLLRKPFDRADLARAITRVMAAARR